MRRIGSGVPVCAIGQLPGNEKTAFAPDLHSRKTLIKSRNETAKALRKSDGLRDIKLRFAIVSHDGLTVFVFERKPVVFRRIEFVAVGSQIAGVEDFVHLVGFGLGAGAEPVILVAQREGSLDDAVHARYAGR